jgi:hypothetical protein
MDFNLIWGFKARYIGFVNSLLYAAMQRSYVEVPQLECLARILNPVFSTKFNFWRILRYIVALQ